MTDDFTALTNRIRACTLCAERFAATATAHTPRPVVWANPAARVLIAGQAPGARVHDTALPFNDRSGERLRGWLGMDWAGFYDRDKVAIVPMGFCFPGYDAKGADLPPPPICAQTWRAQVLDALPNLRLTILIGGYAMGWHLGLHAKKQGVTATLRDWRRHAPATFVLPHPSWRNTGFLRKNPWIEAELLPALRARLHRVLAED